MLLVLLLAHPHLLEGAKGGEDGAADPGAEFLLGNRVDLDFDILRRNLGDLLLEAVLELPDVGVSASQDEILEEIAADVDVGLVDGVEDEVLEASEARKRRLFLEEFLGEGDSLAAERDLLAVGQLVDLFFDAVHGAIVSRVVADVEHLLLHFVDDEVLAVVGVGGVDAVDGQALVSELGFAYERAFEGVTREDLLLLGVVEPGFELSVKEGAADGGPHDGLLDGVAVVDGRDGGEVVAGFNDERSGPAVGEGSEDGRLADEEPRHAVLLEHELGQLQPRVLVVHCRLREQHGRLLGPQVQGLPNARVQRHLQRVEVRHVALRRQQRLHLHVVSPEPQLRAPHYPPQLILALLPTSHLHVLALFSRPGRRRSPLAAPFVKPHERGDH